MPLIEVRMLEGRTEEQKRKLLEAITHAVHESIGSPFSAIRVWVQEFSAKDYMVAGELMADRKGKSENK